MKSHRAKALIVYESISHGNTEKVAKALAKVLQADMVKASDLVTAGAGEYGLIGFGSGIYFARHHRAVLKAAETLDIAGKHVFVFSTAGLPLSIFFHLELKQKLRRGKANIIGEFSCRGWDTYGPYGIIGGINKGKPGRAELERAKEFAKGLIA